MSLFIDTANLEEIVEIAKWGVISGVTTNPKIISKEPGISFKERILEICDIVDGPISVELVNENKDDMIKEAEEYSSWHKNIVIKVPMSCMGLEVIKILEREKNIRTNVTVMMAANQAFLAALAGGTYLSLFIGATGVFTLIGLFIRRISQKRRLPLPANRAVRQLEVSFRQGVLLSLILISALVLQSQRVLVWWHLLVLVGLVGLAEWWLAKR